MHLDVEFVDIDIQPLFPQDEFRQVKGETVGVIESECLLARDFLLASCDGIVRHLVQQAYSRLKSAEESLLFLAENFGYKRLLRGELGIGRPHVVDEDRHQFIHERAFLPEESVTIADGTAQDAADDIARLGVGGQLPVGYRESYRPDVVGHDAHCNVSLGVVTITFARHRSNRLDEGLEDIGVIVGCLALQRHAQTLKAHAGVDDTFRQRLKRPVGLAVVLHEDEVPYFYYLGMRLIDQREAVHRLPLFITAQVNVNLRTRTARAGIPHLPEVVVFVAIDDPFLGQELFPVARSFIVTLKTFRRTALEDGGIKAVG